MIKFVTELIAAKRAGPAEDLLSDLIAARDGGDSLDDDLHRMEKVTAHPRAVVLPIAFQLPGKKRMPRPWIGALARAGPGGSGTSTRGGISKLSRAEGHVRTISAILRTLSVERFEPCAQRSPNR
jgi:hypothetical protein